MEQQTKTRTKAEEAEANEVPTEVNETSAQVMEDACCLVKEIDALLEEAATVTPPPEPEWDPAMSDQPSRRKYAAKHDALMQQGKYDEAQALWAEFMTRTDQWYEARGITTSTAFEDTCTC